MGTKKKKKPGEPDQIEEYTKDGDHECVGVREVDDGKTILYAYDVDRRWERYKIDVVTPHPNNFQVKIGKLGELVVLDNYGDEWMPDELRKPLMQATMFDETIGIWRKTGEIVRVAFIKEKIQHAGCPEEGAPASETFHYSMTFFNFGSNGNYPRMFLPAAYMKRIDELKSKKRPFAITLWDNVLYAYITRWEGQSALQQNLVIDLHFDGLRLQVWNDSWREVSEWKHHDNPWYKGK